VVAEKKRSGEVWDLGAAVDALPKPERKPKKGGISMSVLDSVIRDVYMPSVTDGVYRNVVFNGQTIASSTSSGSTVDPLWLNPANREGAVRMWQEIKGMLPPPAPSKPRVTSKTSYRNKPNGKVSKITQPPRPRGR
jgi:hypothetical protein